MRKKTTQQFIAQCNFAHDSKYDYSDTVYIGQAHRISVICPRHGKFAVIAKRHALYKRGCPVCGIGAVNKFNFHKRTRLNQYEFIQKAQNVHGDKYDYSLVNYTSGKSKVEIICRHHGIFIRRAELHLNSKQGCPFCYNDRRKEMVGRAGYSHKFFELHPEKASSNGIFYVARFDSIDERFIKIGITSKESVQKRFYYKSKNGFTITPVIEFPTTLYQAFLVESALIASLNEHKYKPLTRFGGHTECFIINTQVFRTIDTYLHKNGLKYNDGR